MSSPLPDASPLLPVKTPRKAATAAFLGSLLEYYDFFIYGSAAALIFPTLFFPDANPAIATLSSLATFGVGYAARPIGGLVLGHFGDRIGRKKVLIATVLMMGLATAAVGLLPTYETIGVAAPIFLVLLRLVGGFSAGGEAAGATTLTLEHSPGTRRGFYSSFTQSGIQAGITVATLVFIPISLLPKEALFTWGWRVPFLLSLLVLVLTVWVRKHLDETPSFEQVKANAEVKKFPIVDAVRGHWRRMVLVAVMALFALGTNFFSVFGLAYATSPEVGMDKTAFLTIQVVVTGLSVAAIPLISILSDRIGRRPVLLFAAIGSASGALLYFFALLNGNLLLICVASFLWITLATSCYNATWPAFFAELFPAPVRYTGMTVSLQIGLLLAGFFPMIGFAILGTGVFAWVPVYVLALACWITGTIAILLAPETSKQSNEEIDAIAGEKPPLYV